MEVEGFKRCLLLSTIVNRSSRTTKKRLKVLLRYKEAPPYLLSLELLLLNVLPYRLGSDSQESGRLWYVVEPYF
jgi:hypothetical protein